MSTRTPRDGRDDPFARDELRTQYEMTEDVLRAPLWVAWRLWRLAKTVTGYVRSHLPLRR